MAAAQVPVILDQEQYGRIRASLRTFLRLNHVIMTAMCFNFFKVEFVEVENSQVTKLLLFIELPMHAAG